MSGVITGLDMAEAMAMLPQGCDQDFARRLFVLAEFHFVTAINRKPDSDG
jgi:hypothetical protein